MDYDSIVLFTSVVVENNNYISWKVIEFDLVIESELRSFSV